MPPTHPTTNPYAILDQMGDLSNLDLAQIGAEQGHAPGMTVGQLLAQVSQEDQANVALLSSIVVNIIVSHKFPSRKSLLKSIKNKVKAQGLQDVTVKGKSVNTMIHIMLQGFTENCDLFTSSLTDGQDDIFDHNMDLYEDIEYVD